jgi:hypothetical protein
MAYNAVQVKVQVTAVTQALEFSLTKAKPEEKP